MAAEDSDEDAELVTDVDRSSADDELRLDCLLDSDSGGGVFLTSGVPAAKQKTVRHLEYLHTYLTEVIENWPNITHR